MTLTVPRAAVALVAATALAGAAAAPAEAQAGAAASHIHTTCARQTRVLSTPGGLVVGFLARGAPVIVLRRTAGRSWAEVRAVHSIVGWIHTHDLC
jgi:hypothetical protein